MAENLDRVAKSDNSSIQHFATLPVIYLTTFNRGASFFIHGLVDGHQQVSTTPFIFPLLNLISDSLGYSNIRDPKLISALQSFMQEQLDNENSSLNLEHFSKHYLKFLSKREFGNKEKSIFYAAHYAWSVLNNQEIGRLKVIFWHPHHHNEDYENFIENVLQAKLLFTSKDPREALVSTYKFWETSAGMHLLPSSKTNYLYDELIFYYISSCLNMYAFYLENKNASLVIKTEKMNKDPESSIRDMADFLNIEVTENLFFSTFLGHDKSSYSTRGFKGFNKSINVERWQGELSNFVIIFLELIHYDQLREFEYSPKIVVSREELMALKGNVLQALIRLPRSMRTIMLENAQHDSEFVNGKHLHPNLKKIEIFLRLLRKYSLLYLRRKNIYNHFRNTLKTQLLSLKNR